MKEALSSCEQLKSQLQLELKNAKIELKKQQQNEKLLNGNLKYFYIYRKIKFRQNF